LATIAHQIEIQNPIFSLSFHFSATKLKTRTNREQKSRENRTLHSTILPNRSKAWWSCRSVTFHDNPPTNIRFSSFPAINLSHAPKKMLKEQRKFDEHSAG
jgi:hypothetical protein